MANGEFRVQSESIVFDHPVVIADLSPSTPLSYNGNQVLWIRSTPREPVDGLLLIGAQCERGRDLGLHLTVKEGVPYPGYSKKPVLMADPSAVIMWLISPTT